VEKADDTMERGVVHISPGEGRTLRVWGEMVTYKTTSDQTGGAYSLFEVVSRPGIGPPPPRPAPRGRGLLGAQWGV
jgi:hypothetical protein